MYNCSDLRFWRLFNVQRFHRTTTTYSHNPIIIRPYVSVLLPYKSHRMAATAGLAVVDTRTSGINRGGGLTNRLVAGGSLAHVFG